MVARTEELLLSALVDEATITLKLYDFDGDHSAAFRVAASDKAVWQGAGHA